MIPARAVVFDLYGTLLRLEGLTEAAAAAGAPDPAAFVVAWRRKQLEYAFLSALAQAYRDFDELTALALEHTCDTIGLRLDVIGRERLFEAARLLPLHDDAREALKILHTRGVPLAILTNGVRASASEALAHAGVRELFTAVLSVDDVRTYKPDPRVYTLATVHFDCAPAEIVFVSSNAWDAWGATRFGFRVCWCNRAGAVPEALLPAPAATLASLAELPQHV
jgi:2-haloacid dehalogenase